MNKPVGRGNPLQQHRAVGDIHLAQVFDRGHRADDELHFVRRQTLQIARQRGHPEGVLDADLEETKQLDLVGFVVQHLAVRGLRWRVVHFVAFERFGEVGRCRPGDEHPVEANLFGPQLRWWVRG